MVTSNTNRTLVDELWQEVVKRLGIEDQPIEVQEELVSEISRTIVNRIILEVAKVVPADKHDRIKEFVETGDIQKLATLLEKHIPDVPVFVKHVAKKEIEKLMAEVQVEEERLKAEQSKKDA